MCLTACPLLQTMSDYAEHHRTGGALLVPSHLARTGRVLHFFSVFKLVPTCSTAIWIPLKPLVRDLVKNVLELKHSMSYNTQFQWEQTEKAD